MEKRLILAVLLMIAVAVLPSLLFPPTPPAGGPTDTTTVPADRARVGPEPVPEVPAPPPERVPVVRGAPDDLPPEREAETVTISSALYRYQVSTGGGRLEEAWLLDYESLAPTDSGSLQLVRDDAPLLDHALVMGADTLYFAGHAFTPSRTQVQVGDRDEEVTLDGDLGGLRVLLTYRFSPDAYRFQVRGQIEGLPATGAVLTVGLGAGLRSGESDTSGDHRSYAVVTKARSTSSVGFGKVQPAEVDTLAGPFTWFATKSKYFVAAALANHEGAVPFGGVLVAGGVRDGKVASRLDAVATLPVSQQGTFGYDVYVGPQEHRRLRSVGDDFEDVNPYGWFLRPVIRPIAGVVVNILVWLHERLNLAYGWVLILFGLGIRVLLWPLNHKAMESSSRMQAVAPLMKELQERHKGDQQRLQQEMMRLYKEHNVNPLGGCLPMLLPMPILFALFFVFNNTIEFRGVPFLWLPDLSRPDPIYIIPILMGLSMFALMKLGQRGTPPTPQTKMMVYFMPGMMTVLFLKFSSGLNLYYAATNIFSLPQQWLIARQRAARQGVVARK
jgi:YidC/Oxa1 family membrane protein insertase